MNIYKQRDSLGAAFRIIPFEIKSLESLGVPPAVANFAGRQLKDGHSMKPADFMPGRRRDPDPEPDPMEHFGAM